MEITQLKRSTALKLPKTNSHSSQGSSSSHFPTPLRVGVVLFPPQFPSHVSTVSLSTMPTTILPPELSSPRSSALASSVFSYHRDIYPADKRHPYIRINDCTSIPVFFTLQYPNRHRSGYKQETCVGTFWSHFPSYVSDVPLCPHILPFIGAGAQYLIPQNSHSYGSQSSSFFRTGPHLAPTGKITSCPICSKCLNSYNSKLVGT